MGSAQPQLQTRDSHSVIANSSEDPEQAQLQSLESIIGEFDTMMAEATVEDEEQEEYKGNLSVDYQKWFFDDHLTVNVKKNVTNPLSTPPANLNANLAVAFPRICKEIKEDVREIQYFKTIISIAGVSKVAIPYEHVIVPKILKKLEASVFQKLGDPSGIHDMDPTVLRNFAAAVLTDGHFIHHFLSTVTGTAPAQTSREDFPFQFADAKLDGTEPISPNLTRRLRELKQTLRIRVLRKDSDGEKGKQKAKGEGNAAEVDSNSDTALVLHFRHEVLICVLEATVNGFLDIFPGLRDYYGAGKSMPPSSLAWPAAVVSSQFSRHPVCEDTERYFERSRVSLIGSTSRVVSQRY